MSHSSAHRLCTTAKVVVVTAIIGLFTLPVEAIDLSGKSGKYSLNLDVTLSWGARVRAQDRDLAIIGPFEPATAPADQRGTAWSVNGDDGNLNFDSWDLASNSLKATVDFGFSYNVGGNSRIGFFTRGTSFYDFALMRDCCERTELTDDALDWAGNRTELLDAYAFWQFPIGEIRVGRQVLNWGENTFIQGGLSGINPVDLNFLRVPGAELREAFRPLGMAWASFDLSRNISLEGFYQYEWEAIEIDPPGTYFSSNDFVGQGGNHLFLAFASFPDTGEQPFFMGPDRDTLYPYPFMSVPRTTTREAKDDGQYGLAMRLYVPSWGGTEFGFYYMNVHSKLPTINGITGTAAAAQQGLAAAPGIALAVYAALGVPPGVSPDADAAAAAAAQAGVTSIYAQSANWFTAYPEDIKIYGMSWNAQLGTSGIAFQGEVSHHVDQPFQADDVEVLFAALSPISAGLAAVNQVAPGGLGFEEEVIGFRRLDYTQLQFTFTKIFSNFLGADQGVILGEFGFQNVWDMPSKDELRFEAPGTYTSGNPLMSMPGGAHAGKDYERPEHFADDFSWGYRLAGRLTYNNAIGAWSLIPRFAWSHDVDGNSPGPGGPFLAGRQALTIGIQTQYQNAWQIDLSYTTYMGAGRWNLINDRDFIGGFVKFSF